MIRERLWSRMREIANTREPNEIIGGSANPYMLRWHLTPTRLPVKTYLHWFLRSDDDRAPHDHPRPSLSYILMGRYNEWLWNDETKTYSVKFREAGDLIYRPASLAHRIELINGESCWTLFTFGPKVQEWGYFCDHGKTHWKEFDKTGCG